jgi:glycosyltransferase involved in cell wall biosynthesis
VRVHVLAPDGFADPSRPSGGNNYDRQVCTGLAAAGWDVRVHTVAASGSDGLDRALGAIPDGHAVLIDGLLASPAAAQLLPHAARLRLVVLLHMPLATAPDEHRSEAALRSERAVLGAVECVLVTSAWARRLLLTRYALPADRVHLARPGTDHAGGTHPAERQGAGGRLLSVGVLSPHKGQDVIVDALVRVADLDWHCELVGPADRYPDFVARLRTRIDAAGLGGRIRLAGVLTGPALRQAYVGADLFLAPSRTETYGMAVAEALSFGVPVVAAGVGGLPEALGLAPDGTVPGRLLTPCGPEALAGALREWLRDEDQRRRLRAAAGARRATLPSWAQTARAVMAAVAGPVCRRP